METRKIIGYKYPYETLSGYDIIDNVIKIDRDRCFIQYSIFEGIGTCFIPKEIAESFEPIYEEVILGIEI